MSAILGKENVSGGKGNKEYGTQGAQGGGTEPGHLSSVVQADIHPPSKLLQENRSQVTCVYRECPGQREDSVG